MKNFNRILLESDTIIEAVRNWLKQKRKIHFNCAWKEVLDDLLEDLKNEN